MCVCVDGWRHLWERKCLEDGDTHFLLLRSLGQSAGSPEVGQELEAQAHDEVPDVPGHLRASDEDAPDEDQQHRVERVSDVSQPVNGGSIIQSNTEHSYWISTRKLKVFNQASSSLWTGCVVFIGHAVVIYSPSCKTLIWPQKTFGNAEI